MCRRKLILFLGVLLLAQWACGQVQEKATLGLLRFDAGMDLPCTVSVRDLAKNPQSEPREALTITCGGRNVLLYETDDDLIDLFLNYPHVDRVFALWEGGAHVRLSVFKVDAKHLRASAVFDEQLEGAPEVINAPDVLLIERGKRFPEGRATSLPTSTDVYRWTGETYELSNRWRWNEKMRFEDRFCMLDAKALSCPATPVSGK